MKACHHCHGPVDALLIIGTHTLCPICAKPLHSCYNCRFYSPGAYHDCLEGVEELIVEKKEANFCDFFMLGEDDREKEKKNAEAKKRAEAFFTT